jgi:hypothetical protein
MAGVIALKSSDRSKAELDAHGMQWRDLLLTIRVAKFLGAVTIVEE